MTRTTIQIDETTRKRLVRKRGSMQANTGEDATFDDAINELLDQDKKRRK